MAGQGDRFRRRALSRGYKVDEVDAFLDRVEATLAGEPMGAPVPSQEVDDVVFRVRFGGYDEWQVDVYLDRIARQLGELEERGVLGRAPSPEFAGGPAGNAQRDGGMPMRDSGPVPMHDGPMRGDGPMRDGPMPPPMHDGPMRGDGPMGPRDMPMRDGPMMSPPREAPMGGPRDFGPPRDMPMRDTPPPPDMTMPMREASMPPPRDMPMRDTPGPMGEPSPPRGMPMRDTPGPMHEPSPPRDMPMRQQAPMHGGSEPTMMMNQASPPRDLPPMRDEPSTPPPMNRRPGPPPPPPPGAGGPGPIDDDGEGFGHLRPSDDEGFGHLRGGDDFDDPFAGHRGRRGGAPSGFESAAPMSGPPHAPDDRFGGPPPDDRFGGPPPPPDDRFGGPPPPDDRFGGPPPDDRFGGPPPPPDDRFGGPPPDDRFGPPSGHFDADPRPPQPGGMMPPAPPPPPPGQWGEPVSPAGPPGFDRRPPEPFDQDVDMTRPLRRPMADPPPTLPDSELTQRLRRGGEDRFGAVPPPPPPPGRGGPPPRRDQEPPTPPRGISGDPDVPTMAHPVVQNPPGGRPPSPYDDPQGYREAPPAGPGDNRVDSGRRNPYEGRPYEGRGVFDEPGRHGRDEMTTEMNAGDSPFQPEDVQRVEQLRSSFKPRRFGSGYDPVQVTRIFDAMSSNMTKRAPVPVTDKELDTRQFSLVQQGYFEPEVDAALREVRDIFAKRGMIRD